jgi:D-beta-D-heptose 7-phosphate kinase/D-beta-D-heptose 1-phosphate adenosyltransferase
MIRKKILSPERLRRVLRNRAGKRIVFTNGCFDILHAGHVDYLERARKLGDVLIVALNTDASTRRLKGPTRPVNPLEDRLKVIAALESVSYATWFDEETPIRLIERFLPDLLVKGGDYRVKDIVGYDIVTAHGGKVKTLPFLEGRSTTRVISIISRGRPCRTKRPT